MPAGDLWMMPTRLLLAVACVLLLVGPHHPETSGSAPRFTPLPSPGTPIWRLAVDERGDVLVMVGTNMEHGILDRSLGGWKPLIVPNGAKLLGNAPDGTVYFAVGTSDFAMMRGGAVTALPPVGCPIATWRAYGPEGALWVQCENPGPLARFDRKTLAWTHFPGAVDLHEVHLGTAADGRVVVTGEFLRAHVLESTEAGYVERVMTVPCEHPSGECLGCDVPAPVGAMGVHWQEPDSTSLFVSELGMVGRLANKSLNYEELSRATIQSERWVVTSGTAVDREGRVWLGYRWGSNVPSDVARISMLTPRTQSWALVLETDEMKQPMFALSPGLPGLLVWDQGQILEVAP